MAKHSDLDHLFRDLANSIRTKTGNTGAIRAADFPEAIRSMMTSFPNGTKWTQSNIRSNSFESIYNANGIWVAGSTVNKGFHYSTDGMTWTHSNITSGVFYAFYNTNGIWVAGSSKGLYYSTDGMTWT